MREPNFENLLAVLRNEVPERPTLFEFFLNNDLLAKLAGKPLPNWEADSGVITAFKNAGYDYATVNLPFRFPKKERDHAETISLNDGVTISSRADFDAYEWPEVDDFDYDSLERGRAELPDGMKLIVNGPGGLLENTIGFLGYDNLCFLVVDDPELLRDIVDSVGSRLLQHYERACSYDTVGAAIVNDDWGFKTQPMMSPNDMRKYIIPWHKRIAEVIHAKGLPAIMHSCGNLETVMDDIIDDIKFDAKHSFEDAILPIEDAYKRWGDRIALVGGIDVDFLCTKTTDEIHARARELVKMGMAGGGYALGSGNSIPSYIPDEAYFAMVSAATEMDYSKYLG